VASGAADAERLAVHPFDGVGTRRLIVAVGALALLVQAASAQWLVPSVETPNASREIAERLATGRSYEAAYGARLWGPRAASRELPRAYLLPTEALYLAGIFRILPPPLHRFAHVPIAALLIIAVAAAAASFGGPRVGAAVAAVAALQPFVVRHGPVWDDTFLAAALVWLVLAVLARHWRPAGRAGETRAQRTLAMLGLALASGLAALTRLEAQVILLSIAIAALLVPSLRRLRREGCAVATGVLIGLGLWGMRNHVAVGSFFVGSTHDGIALWESNGPVARAAIHRGQVMALSLDPAIMQPHWDSTARMSEVAANAYFRRAGMRHILGHPLDVIHTALLKLALSISGVRPELPLGSARNVVALVSNALLIVLAVWGARILLSSMTPDARAAMVTIFGIVVSVGLLMLVAGPIGLRYRITLDGVLWIAAGAAVVRLLDTLSTASGHC
jgi:hypothetical protein